MTSTRAQRALRPGTWLALLWLLAACANVLGIEERKVDAAANYPADGYAGCRAGNCGGCLEVHRQECRLRASCADAIDDGDCGNCVCLSCQAQLLDCQQDAGCTSIWQCLRDTRCDLSERAESNCVQACGSIIQANGGLNGGSFRAASAVRSCAATSACLSCLAPQVQQSSRACSQTNGCQDCGACFEQCLCSGERFGECQRLCAGEDAPPAACSQDDACAGCGTCFDACTCGGVSYEDCVNSCAPADGEPAPDPTCQPSSSCVSCAGCVSQCTCSGGGTAEVCEQLCAPPAGSDQCLEAPRGAAACDGCQSCVADCTCGGRSIEQCRADCQEADCCGVPGSCGGSFSNCMCEQSGAECFQAAHESCDSLGPCQACACQQCPGELGMCLDTDGCQQTFECMRATECKGSACLERCRASDYPPQAFAYAEALWACYRGNECSCGIQAPEPVGCPSLQGDVQCAPYVGNVAVAPCCSAGALASEAAGPEVSFDTTQPCGLQLAEYFRGARDCEPRAQPSPPRYELLETCPDAPIAGNPYSGALLKGCCRPDYTCGFFDDITGLGCLSASTFGLTSTACN